MVIMNKKLFLALLPTFLVLTSCGCLNQKSPVDKIKEDNLAHEELFGKLNPKRADPEPASEWNLAPKVGVQHATYEIEEETYYAVRYVAAISGLADGVTASWTRAVAGKDATIVKAQSDGHLSIVTYDTLNNNGTPMTATDEGSGYTKYIVYTIYDIPASQKDSFMMAYLTLSKEAEEPVVSKAIATRLAGTYSFSFDNSTRGYFLGGSIQDNNIYLPNAAEDEHNYAIFQNMDLDRDDHFGVFNYTGTEFKYYGYSSFYTNSYTHMLNNNEIVQPKYFGNYSIKISKDEETRNQVLITRNKLRLDDSTTTYIDSYFDKEKDGWTKEKATIDGIDDFYFWAYGCEPSSGNFLRMGGPSTVSFLETEHTVNHLFNIKAITIKYNVTANPCDNPLVLKPEFYYVASVDHNIYGTDNTYRTLWTEHTFTGDSGTYTVEFESKSISYSHISGSISAYPNFFHLHSYDNRTEGAVNATYTIEYIEITFANELA